MTRVEGAVREVSPGRVPEAIRAAQASLLAAQHPDGHWCGELEGDSILESEYVLLLHFLGRLADRRVAKAARYLRSLQTADGAWAIYPGGPPEVSASVKAYLALKLAGDDPGLPHMRQARETIRRLGGVEACNSFTKIYLAICGQYDWERCPAVPPEMMLLPRGLYFNLHEISAWSRTIVVPLSVIWALRPVRAVPAECGIAELRVPAAEDPGSPRNGDSRFWRRFFHLLDRGLKRGEQLRLTPMRRPALERAEAWILERLEDSDGLGAIFPPIVNTIFALVALGYGQDHPAVRGQIEALEKLEIEEGETLRLQPCFSAVWDTGLALHALADSGLAPGHPAVRAARQWLLEREVTRPGDWSVKTPGAPPGGWCFEYRNPFYPDCDDTAEVLIALAASAAPGETDGAVERGLAWLLAMQNEDGGWGAFDRGCDKEVLTHVPFADHNALLDPSTADVTGRVLECLDRLGLGREVPAVKRAIAFLDAAREGDGTWYGRWGCNYIYGTWLALRGLSRHPAGGAGRQEACGRAVAWLAARQNPDGGWGESPRSYDEPAEKGIGLSTAAQTAWALLALFAAEELGVPLIMPGPAVARGLDYLLSTQRADGTWRDEPWTATGFPRVFYLRYHLYATYFPLMALAEHARRASWWVEMMAPEPYPFEIAIAGAEAEAPLSPIAGDAPPSVRQEGAVP
ncbi:MAG TPA: squalene--hopene cyclase [Thermoanaerobaculia bacterium]|nr:squalene--hopene cyclase [Thermoanaerobaculia bacterium]